MDDNVILRSSKLFALRIVKLYKLLTEEKNEFILSKQLLKAGTSIGANVNEAICAQSKADFCSKMYIAYKEAQETKYWLELLYESEFLDRSGFDSLFSDCMEIIKILSAITKNSKGLLTAVLYCVLCIFGFNLHCTLHIANFSSEVILCLILTM